MAIDLSKLFKAGCSIKMTFGALNVPATFAGFTQKSGVLVQDLVGEGTEGIVNFNHCYLSITSTPEGATTKLKGSDLTPAFWLQERIGKEVVVYPLGSTDGIRGVIKEVGEDKCLGTVFHLQVGKISMLFGWSDIMFVRRRVKPAKAAKPKPDEAAAKVNLGETVLLEEPGASSDPAGQTTDLTQELRLADELGDDSSKTS